MWVVPRGAAALLPPAAGSAGRAVVVRSMLMAWTPCTIGHTDRGSGSRGACMLISVYSLQVR